MLQKVSRSLAMMDGIDSFPGRIDQTTEERIPGIGQTGRVDLKLAAGSYVDGPQVRAPVQVGTIEKGQVSRPGRFVGAWMSQPSVKSGRLFQETRKVTRPYPGSSQGAPRLFLSVC